MGPTFGGKIVLAGTGLLLTVFLLLFFPWWLALIGLFVMIPFFFKVLTS